MKPITIRYRSIFGGFLICTILLTGIATAADAQDTISTPSKFWVGLAVGANLNYYSGSTQNINTSADFGQEPRALESWSISTLRFGMAIKFVRAHNRQMPRGKSAFITEL